MINDDCFQDRNPCVWNCACCITPTCRQEFCMPVTYILCCPWVQSASTGYISLPRMQSGSGCVLMALLPAASPNSAFLLPLLQVVSISGQPRRAYYKFPGPEPWSVGRSSPLRDHLCGTVFLLLCGDQRWLCTLSRDNWRPIFSTADVLANRRNIHHRPALLWRFRDSGAGYKASDLLNLRMQTSITQLDREVFRACDVELSAICSSQQNMFRQQQYYLVQLQCFCSSCTNVVTSLLCYSFF